MVHFYFGYDHCFDGIWWLALIGLIIVCLMFIAFSLLLYKMDDRQRQHEENILRPLTLAYKPQFYFWEFVILMRRLLIAFFAISFDSDDVYPRFTLIIILCIFLKIQIEYASFKIQEVNKLEFNLFLCIFIIIVIDSIYDVNYNTFIYTLLAILILFHLLRTSWDIMQRKRNLTIHT